MKRVTAFVSIVLGLCAGTAKAESCNLSNALNFSAYAIDSMSVTQSDFEGLTGAGNSISARHFRFGPKTSAVCGVGVSVGNSFSGSNGLINGILEITNPQGQLHIGATGGHANFSMSAAQYSNMVDHQVVARHIRDLSNFYKSLESSNAQAEVVNNTLRIKTGLGNVQVVHLKVGSISAQRNIELLGKNHQTLIINVPGKDISMVGLELRVSGLFLQNIIWNFYEASTLRISSLGGLNDTYSYRRPDAYDDSLGLQGMVLAPHATTTFRATKITGQLLTKNINGSVGPAGQIDLIRSQGPSSPCLKIGNPLCRANKILVPPAPERPLN